MPQSGLSGCPKVTSISSLVVPRLSWKQAGHFCRACGTNFKGPGALAARLCAGGGWSGPSGSPRLADSHRGSAVQVSTIVGGRWTASEAAALKTLLQMRAWAAALGRSGAPPSPGPSDLSPHRQPLPWPGPSCHPAGPVSSSAAPVSWCWAGLRCG